MRRLGPALFLLWSLGAGCGNPPPPGPVHGVTSLLSAQDRARFVPVRDCRSSIEHPFIHVVVKVDPAVVARYNQGPFPFPEGTLVVKEEFSDRDCRTPSGTTLMRKEPAGYFPAFGDWRWQRVDPEDKVVEDGRVAGCAGCHAAPACQSRDFVCSEP